MVAFRQVGRRPRGGVCLERFGRTSAGWWRFLLSRVKDVGRVVKSGS